MFTPRAMANKYLNCRCYAMLCYAMLVDDPNLLQPFSTLLDPLVTYELAIAMDATGLSSFFLSDAGGVLLETQYVQHATTCTDTDSGSHSFAEGAVQGLYFGGNCRAPEEVGVQYTS